MAESRNNIIVRGLSGMLGNLVFKNYNGRTFVSQKANTRKVKRTDKQRKGEFNFANAQRYAGAIVKDEAKKQAVAKTLKKGERVYNTLISEFMRGVVRKFEG
ncbi:hypothetical protein [Chryseolinea lacunae]|uniref:Uncharacterized protein n=1 Tax=Chryseolinea lacunae TaxID=2801331 RepID=A0ABS1L0Z6_9BACT|nr:hypothetical protein [Chryseolinea lacunae]MBL0745359.1 hypothetical protein [Chryseolinea lacunae]